MLFVDRLDGETRKAAMREIRNAEWSGLTPPVIKVSPHGGGFAAGPLGMRA